MKNYQEPEIWLRPDTGSRVKDRRDGLLAPFPVPAHQTGLAALPHPAFRLTSPKGTRRVADSVYFINKISLKEWNQKEFAAKLQEPESTKPISSNLAEQIQSFESCIQCTVRWKRQPMSCAKVAKLFFSVS